MARRIMKVIAAIASALLAIAVLSIAAIVFVLPRVTHGEALTVLTGSMQPTIPPGSIVFVRPADPHNVRVGDVITFAVKSQHYGTSLVTHRVVAEKLGLDASGTYEPVFTTKGDANNAPDAEPVLAQNVRGIMWFHVPHIGGIRDAMHTKGGVAGIAVIVLGVYAAVQVVAAHKDHRRKPSPQIQQHAASLPAWVIAEMEAGEFVTVARFDAAGFDGASARAVTRLLGGTLINESADTFSVLLSPDADGNGANAAFLHSLDPEAVWSSAAGAMQEGAATTRSPVDAETVPHV